MYDTRQDRRVRYLKAGLSLIADEESETVQLNRSRIEISISRISRETIQLAVRSRPDGTRARAAVVSISEDHDETITLDIVENGKLKLHAEDSARGLTFSVCAPKPTKVSVA